MSAISESTVTTSAIGPIVDVDRVFKHFRRRRALTAVSLRVEPKQIVALLGPNGGGKTTLFRILSTLLKPDGGKVRVCGFDPVRQAAELRRCFGVVFQSPSLDKKLTAAENLRHHGHLYGLSGRALKARIDQVLRDLHIADRAGDLVETLSGGLARRVEIAKSMLHRPQLLLLDEPSTGLDPVARRDLADQLHRLRDEHGVTVLMTTHVLDEAARCDRVAILDKGHLVAEGAPSELTAQVSGEVIHIETHSPEALAARVAGELNLPASVVDGKVYIETHGAAEQIARIARVLDNEAAAITWSRPTLEDVFIHMTGRTFHAAEEEEATTS